MMSVFMMKKGEIKTRKAAMLANKSKTAIKLSTPEKPTALGIVNTHTHTHTLG